MNKDSCNLKMGPIKDLSIEEQQSNSSIGITQEYNKENRDKLWDSQKGKADYKDKVFGDKESYVEPIRCKIMKITMYECKQQYQ